MDSFVTVATFDNPTSLLVLRSRLEDEGIEYRIPDELTTQVNPLYSVAMGGLRLQVRESDVSATIAILKELDYWHESAEPPFLESFDRATAKLSWLNSMQPVFRFLLLVGVCLVLILMVVYIVAMASDTHY